MKPLVSTCYLLQQLHSSLAILLPSSKLLHLLQRGLQSYGIPAIESLHRESGVSDILLDTPWATVFVGGKQQMSAAIDKAIRHILIGRHHTVLLPHIPTEEEWASHVALLGNWSNPVDC